MPSAFPAWPMHGHRWVVGASEGMQGDQHDRTGDVGRAQTINPKLPTGFGESMHSWHICLEHRRCDALRLQRGMLPTVPRDSDAKAYPIADELKTAFPTSSQIRQDFRERPVRRANDRKAKTQNLKHNTRTHTLHRNP